MTQHRLRMLQNAAPHAEFEPTELITRARYVKFPEEIALHREAARITDLMLEAGVALVRDAVAARSEEHTSELQSLMRISYAVFCLKKKKITRTATKTA